MLYGMLEAAKEDVRRLTERVSNLEESLNHQEQHSMELQRQFDCLLVAQERQKKLNVEMESRVRRLESKYKRIMTQAQFC